MTEEHSLETLSIVIPVFNEVKSLKEIIERVREVQLPQISSREIVIVDDYSTDGTRDVLATYKDQNAFKIIFHDRNRGKGAALRTGIAETTGSIVIIQDADLEYDPQEYPKLLAPILDGKADVVYGSRFAGGDSRRVHFFWHSVGNRFLTTLSNVFTNINLTDMETCYKVFLGKIIRDIPIEESRFGFEPEITSKIARNGCRIY